MGYRLREIDAESKFSRELSLEAISEAVPLAEVEAALQAEGKSTNRERKLNMVVTVFVVISMSVYTAMSIGHVLQKMAKGLRYIWPDPDYAVAGDSALTYRRYQLGARVLVGLFHRVCRPIATEDTAGAYLFGYRLMALDGTVEEIADTPANAAVFGRHRSGRGTSAYPQGQAVYLCECGTHVIVDAGIWPIHTSERVGGFRMLRSVEAGMLVLWDRGFHDYDMFVGVRQRQAHVLSRLPAHVKPKRVATLADGSYLATLHPSAYQRKKRGEHLVVRIIEYTLTDPNRDGYRERHRLITTLLDAHVCPALELVCAYHERWEIEVLIDEIDTHQRLLDRPLRSLKPVGVVQEFYGLLIAHFAIRFLMLQAACYVGVDPDRLSFVHAVEVIRDAIPEFQMTALDQRAQLYQRLLRDLAAVRLPIRRLRANPRVIKRKMSKFRVKRPEHDQWPQPSVPFRDAVALI